MRDIFGQHAARLRFEWGLPGALTVSDEHSIAVVVDVLSFTTAVSVAVDRGIEVFPFPWRDDRAAQHAEAAGAVLARGRREGTPSLSPASLRRTAPLERLVLPSPNGATISFALAERGGRVIAGCLRNASAVAAWLAGALAAEPAANVAVIAAGERWPDGDLRPAVEDLWGAGAILGPLRAAGLPCSPEAEAAANAYAMAEPGLDRRLAGCSSGLELVSAGFGEDVSIAAELDGSRLVPVLIDGRFRADLGRG